MTNSVVLTEEMIIAAYDLFDMIGYFELAIEALVYEHNLSEEVEDALYDVLAFDFIRLEREADAYELAMLRAYSSIQDVYIEILNAQRDRLLVESALRKLELEIQQRKDKEYFLSQGCSEFVAKMKTAMLYVDGRKGDDGLELV